MTQQLSTGNAILGEEIDVRVRHESVLGWVELGLDGCGIVESVLVGIGRRWAQKCKPLIRGRGYSGQLRASGRGKVVKEKNCTKMTGAAVELQ